MYNSISDWQHHQNTIWADDAFMAVSFISRMGEVTGEKKYFDDWLFQYIFEKHHPDDAGSKLSN